MMEMKKQGGTSEAEGCVSCHCRACLMLPEMAAEEGFGRHLATVEELNKLVCVLLYI
jgi:hypothetical protein